MKYVWKEEKNRKLKEERGISFEDIVFAISSGRLIGIEDNLKVEYEGQRILVVCIDGYLWEVPCRIEEDKVILITAYPCRKRQKEYIKNYGKSCG